MRAGHLQLSKAFIFVIFCTFDKVNLTSGSLFKRPGPEADYFLSEIGLEEFYLTLLDNHNPKCSALAFYYCYTYIYY